MEHFPYLIVGGGMAAAAAVKGIRSRDVTSPIAILSEDKHPPYERPPLSKGLWTGKSVEEIFFKVAEHHVTLFLGKKAVAIDPEKHEVKDHLGNSYHYGKLLIATGVIPNRLNLPDQGVIYLRNLDDFLHIRALYEKGNDFVVIGAGFIGTEIAASLKMNGKNVSLIYPEPSIGKKIFPPSLSNFLDAYYVEHGVNLLPQDQVLSIIEEKGRYRVTTAKGREIFCDGVIAGIGAHLPHDLAKMTSVDCDNGILVNEYLQCSRPDIYAAGDNTNFFSSLLEKRMRVEHEDNARHMGLTAGKNMAGASEPYHYHPYFYSDLFDLGYEALGEISSDMEMVEAWEEDYRRGTVYYLKDKRVRGALLWGVWNQVERIRELISSKRSFELEELKEMSLLKG